MRNDLSDRLRFCPLYQAVNLLASAQETARGSVTGESMEALPRFLGGILPWNRSRHGCNEAPAFGKQVELAGRMNTLREYRSLLPTNGLRPNRRADTGRSEARQLSGYPRLARLLFAALFTSILIAIPLDPAIAAEAKAEALDALRLLQEETVVTAIRHEQPISEAPSNIYVITDEDIRHSGATDLPTLLRRIPGIEVMQMTGADFNVSVRGNNQLIANKILVMVDGRSIYVDVQAQFFWKRIPVTLPEIKRIEVLKGPASALYGFNAFDGVVHIITKSPEEMKGTTLQVGVGELGTLTSSAIHAGTQGKWGYRLSLNRDQNQQWRNRDALAYRSHMFNVQIDYRLPRESKLLISGGLVDANRFDGLISQDTVSSTELAQGYTHVAYERPGFYVRGFWNRDDITADTQFNPPLAPFLTVTDRDGNSVGSFISDTYNVEAQHAVKFGSAHRLTYGVNYRHNALSSNQISGFSREDRLGLYTQHEWELVQGPRPLSVITGLRYDLHNEINSTFSPRIALLYKVAPDHTLRTAISLAYRPPTLFETNEDFRVVSAGGTTTVTGNPNLDPEQIISYEAGYQGWFFRHRLRARIDLFFNHISDLISTRGTGPTTSSPANGEEADIYGGEAGIDFQALPWLSGFANYAYQEFGQSIPQTVAGQRGAPRFTINAGLRGEWENGLSSEVVLHHVGAATYPRGGSTQGFIDNNIIQPVTTRAGSYNLLNLRGAYQFWDEKAEAAVTVFNALNDKHKEHPLGDTIGSRVMGWLTIKF